jgi:hypothetical protein
MAPPADGGGNQTDSRVGKTRFMAITRGHPFGINFDSEFPQGLVPIGEVQSPPTAQSVSGPPRNDAHPGGGH